jgi:hypothetical protein
VRKKSAHKKKRERRKGEKNKEEKSIATREPQIIFYNDKLQYHMLKQD